MAKPTVNPKRTVISGVSLIDGSVLGPKLGTNSVGLTQTPTAIQRNVTVVSLGVTPATGKVQQVFRAPASGATITYLGFNPGSDQNHAANEADTWAFTVTNKTTGNALNALGSSLSNMTLEATAFKSIPIDNGAATLLSGEMLDCSLGISNAPAALENPVLVIEWVPYTNA